MDTKTYLQRLDLDGTGGVNYAALEMMHQRHLLLVPFENLDVIEGLPISLDVRAVYDKIVTRRRGGFCYELNTAFAWLLKELGFEVRLLAAEMHREGETFGIPFDHMALRVDLPEGPFLVDVGSGNSFRNPLPLAEDDEIRQFGETYGLRRVDDYWLLERYERTAMGMVPVYRFKDEACEVQQFSAACQFHQTSPESTFTRGLIVTVATPDGRVKMTDAELIINQRGRREVTEIKSEEQRSQMLKRYFRIKSAMRIL